jgi:hypothetical protein
MADFALVATAAEESLGLEGGAFMQAFTGNRQDANDLALEASPVGPAILAFMNGRDSWEGTSTALLAVFEKGIIDEKTRARRDWPKGARAMRGALQRVAPNLRSMGVDVSFGQRGDDRKRSRLIVIRAICNQPSAPSASSGIGPGGAGTAIPSGRSTEGRVPGPGGDRPQHDGHLPADGADGRLQDSPTVIPEMEEVPGEPRTLSELEIRLALHAEYLGTTPRQFIEDIFECDLDDETLTDAGLRHLTDIVRGLERAARASAEGGSLAS